MLQDLNTLHLVPANHDAEPPHGFAVGISHYHKDKGKSYIQVHDDMVHDDHDSAVAAVHARIDLHAGFEHGKYDPVQLNPNEQYPHDLVRQNAEYHPNPYGSWDKLPKIDAITGEPLTGDDIYVPHVDNCRLGHCYQAILQEMNGGRGSLEMYNLGCATLENAIVCAHAIVDEILVPYALNKESVTPSQAPEVAVEE